MEDEYHFYTRGYESDDNEECYGLEGLISELINFSVDLLKRNNIFIYVKNLLLTFLLCIKGYCFIPHNSIILWKNDPNLYITEEYDDENINTIRSKSLNLIKEITKEIDDDSLLKFFKILLSELTDGINLENYEEVIKLDDYDCIKPYFEKLNSKKKYNQRNQEANLLIIGSLSEDILILKEKNKIEKEEIDNLMKFLFSIISNPKQENSILIGRAVWCVSRLLSLIKNDDLIMNKVFNSMSIALCHPESDLSICLVASQCLSNISRKLSNKNYENDNIINNYKRLIILLKQTNEETIEVPIDCILNLSNLNKEKAMYVPYNSSKLIVEIYSTYYNHPVIGAKLLLLIKLWCKDNKSAKTLISLFIPFDIFVFDDFFKGLGKSNSAFEDIKKTVMTEHAEGANMGLKTNLDMLPVN